MEVREVVKAVKEEREVEEEEEVGMLTLLGAGRL